MNTSLRRITRVNALAFYSLLLGVGFALAMAGPLVFIDLTDPGPWLRPDGTERPAREVYGFAAQLALVPLVPGLLVWAWAVSRWTFVLRSYRQLAGRVESISRNRDIWEVRFSYPGDPVESYASAHVLPVPSVRSLRVGQPAAVLVSRRDPERALLRAFLE
jgi:hypothetical protein